MNRAVSIPQPTESKGSTSQEPGRRESYRKSLCEKHRAPVKEKSQPKVTLYKVGQKNKYFELPPRTYISLLLELPSGGIQPETRWDESTVARFNKLKMQDTQVNSNFR